MRYCLFYIPFSGETNPGLWGIGLIGLKPARFEGKDLEIGLHSFDDLRRAQAWRTTLDGRGIIVSDYAQPQAPCFQIAGNAPGKAIP